MGGCTRQGSERIYGYYRRANNQADSAIIDEQNQNWTAQQDHIKNQIGNFIGVGAPTTAEDGTLKKQYDNIDAQIISVGV